MPTDTRTEVPSQAPVRVEPVLSLERAIGEEPSPRDRQAPRPEGAFPFRTSPLLVTDATGFGQALELAGLRWTLAIVGELGAGASRFSELTEALGISARVLSRRLHMLTAYGIVKRRCYDVRSERYEYLLTERGRELHRVVSALGTWGEKHFSPAAA